MSKKYITYETPFRNQVFTQDKMEKIYKKVVDKTEYPDFETWIFDMVKSGVFEEIEALRGGCL